MEMNEFTAELAKLCLLDDGFHFQVPKVYIHMAGDLKSGILLGCIEHLTQKDDPFKIMDADGSCWIHRQKEGWYDECALAVREVTRCLKVLTKKQLLETRKMTPVEIMNVVKRKDPQQLNDPFARLKICCWCRSETYILHEHHYPVPLTQNGSETVEICANCHSEYHFLKTITLLRLNKDIINNENIMHSTPTERTIDNH